MPRPRVSPENQQFAIEFAKMVTTDEGAADHCVARHGPLSIYAMLQTCHPRVIRDDTATSNRKGISKAEFLRALNEIAKYTRFRDRKAVKMCDDPTGAGMCMFRSIRWRDPNSTVDLQFLRQQHKRLTETHAAYVDVSFETVVSALTTFIAAWNTNASKQPRRERASSIDSSSSDASVNSNAPTTHGSPAPEPFVSLPDSNAGDASPTGKRARHATARTWPEVPQRLLPRRPSKFVKREISTKDARNARIAHDDVVPARKMHGKTPGEPSADRPCNAEVVASTDFTCANGCQPSTSVESRCPPAYGGLPLVGPNSHNGVLEMQCATNCNSNLDSEGFNNVMSSHFSSAYTNGCNDSIDDRCAPAAYGGLPLVGSNRHDDGLWEMSPLGTVEIAWFVGAEDDDVEF
jgi:hypothetical protein